MVECMVRPVGFEPTTNRFEVCDSIQLSYGRFLSCSGNTAIGNKNRDTKAFVKSYRNRDKAFQCQRIIDEDIANAMTLAFAKSLRNAGLKTNNYY